MTETEFEGAPRGASRPTAGPAQVAGALPDLGPLPVRPIREGPYEIRFARTEAEREAALRLRFEVFNLELGEGLAASHATGLDTDAFDPHCHHLLVIDTRADVIVGTYRMQTQAMSARGAGFYCDGEFDLSTMPAAVLDEGIEVGRACIAKEHRRHRVLFGLWKGLAAYLDAAGKRYLFGCCSLTSQDPAEGLAVMAHLSREGHVHPSVVVRPRPGFACTPDEEGGGLPTVKVPPLFATYLRYDARVYGPPAVDRQFKTIDFLVVTDTHDLDPEAWQLFFGRPGPPRPGPPSGDPA